jgi:arylsulfatase A-like enzyme
MFNKHYLQATLATGALGAAFEASWQLARNYAVLRPPLGRTVAADALVAWAVTAALFWVYAAAFRATRRRRDNSAEPTAAAYAAIAAPFLWFAGRVFLPQAKLSWAAALTLAVLTAPVVGAAVAAFLRRRQVAAALAGAAAATLLVLTAVNLLEQTRPLEPDRANVVLITLDTTRADHIGCYGYSDARTPNLDRLAEAGVQFDRALCLVPLTAPSHATIMTSLYPETTGVVLNGMRLRADVPTLGEQFLNVGYATAAFVASSSVCARDTALDRGFELYDDAVTPAEGYHPSPMMPLGAAEKLSLLAKDDDGAERPADEVTDAALRWLERRRHRPFFLWLHYFDPHDDYLPPAAFAPPGLSGRHLQERINKNWAGGKGGPNLPANVAALYDGEIAFMDAEIGRFLDALDDMGMRQRTTVVVVADHGEAFGEHGTKYHGFRLYHEEIEVPLIVCDLGGNLPPLPDAPGPVSALDVAPTILDLAGIPIPPSMRGHALFRETESSSPIYCICVPEVRRESKYAIGRLEALVAPGEKLIVHNDGSLEYYDLAADPFEKDDVADERRDRVAALLATIEGVQATVEPAPAAVLSTDQDTIDKLRALGYIK